MSEATLDLDDDDPDVLALEDTEPVDLEEDDEPDEAYWHEATEHLGIDDEGRDLDGVEFDDEDEPV